MGSGDPAPVKGEGGWGLILQSLTPQHSSQKSLSAFGELPSQTCPLEHPQGAAITLF